MSKRQLKLDLHPFFNKGELLDKVLTDILQEARDIGAKEVEIIHGKGSGQLKKRVMRFLQQKQIRPLYQRIKKDPQNHGRLFVVL